MSESRNSFAFFLTVNGFVACLFFYISGRFRAEINGITLAFSLLYAGIVVVCLFSSIKAMQLAEIANVNVASNAGSLLVNAIVGFWLFKEALDPLKLLRILLMLIGLLLIFWERRTKKHPQKTFPLALLGMVAGALGNNLILKLYASTPNVADENSFFLLTNAFLAVGAGLWFGLLQCKKAVPIRPLLHPRTLFPFIGNTLFSNFNSLISLQLLATLELSLYTPLVGALGCLINLTASLLFREKLGIYSYLAAALALIAAII